MNCKDFRTKIFLFLVSFSRFLYKKAILFPFFVHGIYPLYMESSKIHFAYFMSEEKEKVTTEEVDPKQKKSGKIKYLISIGAVVVLTAVSIILSLFSAGDGNLVAGGKIIIDALKSANLAWLFGLVGMVVISYAIDALIIFIFGRLYTRKYKYHQAVANGLIGAFYSAVTPGASGGQVMQAYIMKRQGIAISNSASIFVMWFILYQINLIIFDIVTVIVEWGRIMNLASFEFTIGSFSITLLPLIIIGFALNVGVLALLFLMSYSHHFHNFIMHRVVNLGAKLRLIKNPDKTRENLRVQVENFKIELRRLLTNIPVALLLSTFFMLNLFIRFSMPYFSASAFGATGEFSFGNLIDTCFLSAFHQMITGIFPIPGAAGVSELFYLSVFKDVIGPTYDALGNVIREASANMASSQILWRTATFHLVVLVSGITSAIYQVRPSKEYHRATYQSFVTLQLETYELRKLDVDKIYETKQISKEAIKAKMAAKRTNRKQPGTTQKSTKKLIKKYDKKDKNQ